MKTYSVEIVKKIVVEVEANSKFEALQTALYSNPTYDGAWEKADPFSAKVLDLEED